MYRTEKGHVRDRRSYRTGFRNKCFLASIAVERLGNRVNMNGNGTSLEGGCDMQGAGLCDIPACLFSLQMRNEGFNLGLQLR